MSEPYGHRGHPTSTEVIRAAVLRPRLGVTLAVLCEHGFSFEEARGFVAGVAWEIGAHDAGETWSDLSSAKKTLDSVLFGRAAKEWSLGLLDQAIEQIKEAAL
jgi:hypothetical protein